MAEREIYLTKEVFVAGSAPKITYNPRSDRHLEQELEQYLDQASDRRAAERDPPHRERAVIAPTRAVAEGRMRWTIRMREREPASPPST